MYVLIFGSASLCADGAGRYAKALEVARLETT